MTPLSTLIDAIEAADLPIAVYRTAVRLARVTDAAGRAVMDWDEYQVLTGCGHADAARRHLRSMRAANLISWRGGVTVVVVWLVGRQYVSENRQLVSENRQLLRVDNNNNEYYHEENAQQLPTVDIKIEARKKWLCMQRAVIVWKSTASVGKQTRTVGKQAATARTSYVRARAVVCLIDPLLKQDPVMEETTKQTIKQPDAPARDENALAYELLVEVGVMPDVAKKLTQHGFELVRRAVAAWWVQRKEVGGKLENHPGAVVYWLNNPGKRGFGPKLPQEWIYSDIGEKYMTDAERKRYTPAQGVYDLGAVASSATLPSKPAPPVTPLPGGDKWQIALGELRKELPGGYVSTLEGSAIREAGMVNRDDGKSVPVYDILIAAERAQNGLVLFERQCSRAIRLKLGSLLGYPIEIRIKAAEGVAA